MLRVTPWRSSRWLVVLVVLAGLIGGILTALTHHDEIVPMVQRGMWLAMALISIRIVYLQSAMMRMSRTSANFATLAAWLLSSAASMLGVVEPSGILPWILYGAATPILWYAVSTRKREHRRL